MVPIAVLLAAYFIMVFYYRNGFIYGTWINGTYCTGKTVEEINREFMENTEFPDIVIVDENGRSNNITMEEIDYRVDYSGPLYEYIEKQNVFLWFANLFEAKNHQVLPAVSYNEEKLSKALNRLPLIKQEVNREKTVKITWTVEGYVLKNTMEDVLDTEKLYEIVRQNLEEGSYEIRLAEADCYGDLELTAEMKKVLRLWEKVEKFQQCDVVYDIKGEKVPITKKDSSLWIMTDTQGNFILDEDGNLQVEKEAVEEYVSGLALKYDTYGKTREFKATCGVTVQIEGGTYGSQMDQKKETEYLLQAFLDRVSETHEPAYKKKSNDMGEDIGDTYIEVDLTDQKMYYYENGELKLETDVVTGNMKKGHDTPAGVNYVYAKQRNRTLRGADYESFVRYWMPVAGNIGIHDASWRSKFGGDIYLTRGSHGCINTPHAKMKELFDMVEIGVPVVMFYHD